MGSRQFFGYLIPGALWMASGMLLALESPLYHILHPSLTSAILFVIGSYFVGHMYHSAIFHHLSARSVKKLKSNAKLNRLRSFACSLVKWDSTLGNISGAEEIDLTQFFKKVVIEGSQKLHEELLEREADINLLSGSFLPSGILGALLIVRTVCPEKNLPTWASFILAGAVLIACSIFMYRHFYKCREWEEEAWYTNLAVWEFINRSAASGRPDAPSASVPEEHSAPAVPEQRNPSKQMGCEP